MLLSILIQCLNIANVAGAKLSPERNPVSDATLLIQMLDVVEYQRNYRHNQQTNWFNFYIDPNVAKVKLCEIVYFLHIYIPKYLKYILVP